MPPRQLFTLASRHYNTKNPVKVTPQPRRAEVKPFKDLEELERVAIELGEWGDTVRFVGATGMRPEEWIPLEPSDVDEEGRDGDDPAHLHRAQGPRRVRRQDRRLDPIRTIPLSAAALAAYQAQRRRSPDSPLVFPAPRGGYLNLRNWRNRDWHPALGAAGVAPRGPTHFATPSPPGFCSTQTTAGSSPN